MIMLEQHWQEFIGHINRPQVTVQLEDTAGEPFEAYVYIDELTPEEEARVHPDDLHLLQKHRKQR